MRERLLHAPAWVLAVIGGGAFGALWTLLVRIGQDGSWTRALVLGAVAGGVFGALYGPTAHRRNRRVRDAAARSPEGLSPRVRRAASRGPVPADPEVREAARGLVLAQLEPMEEQRISAPVLFVIVAGVAVWLAVAEDPRWLLAALFFAGVAAVERVNLLRLRRRAALLDPDS